MNIILTITLLLLTSSLFFPKTVSGANFAGSSAAFRIEAEIQDDRDEKIEKFLKFYNSPLAKYSNLIVSTADKYEIDWRLLVSISGVESTFGKRIPEGSFNAYGWNNGNYRFQSWEDSIEHVSRVLGEKYVQKGLDTPAKMARVYCPYSNTWAGKVTYFMKKLENFYPNDPSNIELSL